MSPAIKDMSPEYADNLERGWEYQDFITEYFWKYESIPIVGYSSLKYQLKYGENRQGWEIKLDARMHETKNIYIEVASDMGGYDDHWQVVIEAP